MLDDKNKDPTFTYKVPDTVYKVPTPQHHAAELVGLLGSLGYCVKGDTFIDMVEDAFNFRWEIEEYGRVVRMANTNEPSPLGNPEPPIKIYDTPQQASFAKQFEVAERKLNSAGRSLAYPDNDAGLWIPLSDD